MKVLLLALSVCVAISYTSAFDLQSILFPRCPPNCASSNCHYKFGCTNCQAGYCRQSHNSFGICTRECPSGSFCNVVRFCNKCRVSNCEACTSNYDCSRCKRGYTLSGNRCSRRWG